ncbi:TetR/AcrR family transcriptional regulator [Roseibium salinum]|uniref:TetR/AcrR family transcriptional regulator n=2 Tax=Roseibium salinum TaxID=1604349 RepID=A0ABT3R1Q3_9HYPH|nr:TetR/AcrR family transcriptional regulator [Roseibium sp. DSM 29163]MCX2722887.1 TetR/AcrR family transcriptional regulator [Roseibium sp. DSM 29163]
MCAATNLNRPSLYAAFGGKKDIYLKVVERFADQVQSRLREAGRTAKGAKGRLKAIMAAAIDLYTGRTGLSGAPYGCLAISTLPSEAARDKDIQSALETVTARMDKGFASLIRHEMQGAIVEEEIRTAAQLLALMLHGLSIRARAGEKPERLKQLAECAVDRIIPAASPETL